MRFCGQWSMLLGLAGVFAWCGLRPLGAAGLDWQPEQGYRRAPVTLPASGKTGFSEMAQARTGIQFTNLLNDDRSLTNQIYLNGAGVAAGDVDGDGLCDLYFCGLDSPNVLYRNRGDWRFEDITTTSGVVCADQASTGAALADLDGDGDLDLLVNGVFRGARLFLNDGQARFREVTAEAGWRSTLGGVSFAVADLEGDGDLDVYVVNYRSDTMRDLPDLQFTVNVTNGMYQLQAVNGRPATAPDLVGRFTFDQRSGVLENGEPDSLFRNLGQARFTLVDWRDGTFRDDRGQPIAIPYDWGLSAMFHDFNGDRAPDLYVCNDFQSPDRLWINDGHGGFRPIASEALRHTSLFSMAMDCADIDRDGKDDFLVADMLSPDHARRQIQVMESMAYAQLRNTDADRPQYLRSMLFHNRGNGTYAEIAQFAGVDASDWTWSPIFLDVDLDGYEDLLIATGHWRDAQHRDVTQEIEELSRKKGMTAREKLYLRKRFPRLDTPNYLFRNRGDLTFEETGAAWGFNSRRVCQGMALADLDNDGDLDVVINCLNDAPLLLRNETARPRLAVRLRGLSPNTRGIGAKIRVQVPGLPPQSQEMICGGRYLSSDDAVRTFAAGDGTNRALIEVTWRNGSRSICSNVPVNQIVEVDEAGASPAQAGADPTATTDQQRPSGAADPSATNSLPFFVDVSQLLAHRHVDEPFDDFARQTLLPHKLSQMGPGVSWFDFNGDGWEDLLIGAGRGGRLAAFRNDGKGGFVPQRAKIIETATDRDLTAVLGWRPNPTDFELLIGLDSYELGVTNAPAVRRISLVTGASDDDLLHSPSSTGPLALGDVDGDGDLDLFVGGRVVAGRYPEAASSALLRNTDGRLQWDREASDRLAGIGLVNSAIFSDLDGNGWPELVVACDWGPIRVFRNERGKLTAWDAPLRWTGKGLLQSPPGTLQHLTGWWTAVAAGDFDNDGRIDLVAGNWGRNTSRRRFAQEPLRLYFGEFASGADLALLEAQHDARLGAYVPTRDLAILRDGFPSIRERFPTFTSFSTASVADVLAAGLPPMQMVTAATLDSVLLLNRGDHFDVQPLPTPAQLAPVFGIVVGDLDGDGNEDLFLAQNFFGVFPVDSRYDAGCGLWLRGNGRGAFTAVPPSESGLAMYAEGRGAAVCDFDHDGRLDLAVGQNRGTTKLYRNAGARPGLSVRLEGAAENLQAIGAAVRLHYSGGRAGPVHEVRLGGGWYSQDAPTVVLGCAGEPAEVEIRWPSRVTERAPLATGQRQLARPMPKTPASSR